LFAAVWHIDGLPAEDSGVPMGDIRNFTLLVGVCLQDVTTELAGNLVVYPRSHHIMQSYFRERGFDEAKRGLTSLPALPLPEPVQVTCRAGDCVICHYSLCHSVAPNASPDIRYMTYFRINVRAEGQHHPEPMLNIWTDLSPRFQQIDRASSPVAASSSSSSSSSSSRGTVTTNPANARPGYADALVRQQLNERLAADASSQRERQDADALFSQGKFSECVAAMVRLVDAAPNELMTQFKAAVCLTASGKENLREGERRMRAVIAICKYL
jgi:hypothetical protein